jgi:hypothetical protein
MEDAGDTKCHAQGTVEQSSGRAAEGGECEVVVEEIESENEEAVTSTSELP